MKIRKTNVFKRQFSQMRSCLEHATVSLVVKYRFQSVKQTVFEVDIRRLIGIIHTRKIIHGTKCIVSTLRTRQIIVFALDDGHTVRIKAGAVCVAILNEDPHATHAEQVAGGIENTSSDRHVLDIDTRDTIVAGLEHAILDQRVLGTMQMNTVRSCETGHAAHNEVLAVIRLVQEVSAVLRRISFQMHVFATGEEDGVRSAVMLLPIGIIAIRAVNHGITLTDNRNVLLTVCGNDRAAVSLPRRSVLLRDQLHVRAHLHALGDRKHLIVVAIVATVKLRACFEIKRGIRSHPQCADVEASLGDHDCAACVFTQIKHCLKLCSLQSLAVFLYTVIGNQISVHHFTFKVTISNGETEYVTHPFSIGNSDSSFSIRSQT